MVPTRNIEHFTILRTINIINPMSKVVINGTKLQEVSRHFIKSSGKYVFLLLKKDRS